MTIEIVPVRNPGFDDMPKTLYSPIVDGKQLSVVAESEDIAYILGLQFKYDGPEFAKMACRMLNIETKWTE